MAPTADLYNSAAMKMQLAGVLLQRLLTRLIAPGYATAIPGTHHG
jgi:hypothetical protein